MAQVAAPNMRLPMVNSLLLDLQDMESVLSNCKAMMVLLTAISLLNAPIHAVFLHLMCMKTHGLWGLGKDGTVRKMDTDAVVDSCRGKKDDESPGWTVGGR